ncbi:MAG: sugar ABC transporter permease [Geminicoccaceae bacterium]
MATWDQSSGQSEADRLALAIDRVNPLSWLGRLSESRGWAWFLLLPTMVLLALIVVYPTLYGIALSFQDVRLLKPNAGGFVGLRHYQDMLDDPIFWLSLRNTVVWVVLACLLELGLGLASALALDRALPGLKVATVLILLPWFLPKVVAGNMWALMLDSRLGVLNDILVRLGILDQYKAWFADPSTALVTAVVVESWHSFPFFTLLLIAALRGIPDEMHQAAAVDGATAVQRFWHITLPMLKVVIVAAVVLRVIGLVNSPDLLLILTSGGPGHATMVLSLYAFETAYRGFDFGYAGALAVIMLLLLMVFAWAYVRVSGVMARQ